ncbi:hypothetical protein [Acidovorax soli]|uniref:hypothetical protein n=1 Tax=Acidovorax soli TaxID=592050 RepID=UPI0032B28E90
MPWKVFCKALSGRSAGGARNASGPIVLSAQLVNEAFKHGGLGVVISQKKGEEASFAAVDADRLQYSATARFTKMA